MAKSSARCISLLTSASGGTSVDQLGQGVGGPLEHELAHLGQPYALHLAALGITERLGRLEVGVLAAPTRR